MAETNEKDAEILELLMVDLGKAENMPALQKKYLQSLISSARTEIKREGVTIDDESADDLLTVSMYAAYLYRKRAKDGDDSKMPRYLRYRLNNRVLSEKAQAKADAS